MDDFGAGTLFGLFIGVMASLIPGEHVNPDIFCVSETICQSNEGVAHIELDTSPVKVDTDDVPEYAKFLGVDYDITCNNGAYFKDIFIGKDYYADE